MGYLRIFGVAVLLLSAFPLSHGQNQPSQTDPSESVWVFDPAGAISSQTRSLLSKLLAQHFELAGDSVKIALLDTAVFPRPNPKSLENRANLLIRGWKTASPLLHHDWIVLIGFPAIQNYQVKRDFGAPKFDAPERVQAFVNAVSKTPPGTREFDQKLIQAVTVLLQNIRSPVIDNLDEIDPSNELQKIESHLDAVTEGGLFRRGAYIARRTFLGIVVLLIVTSILLFTHPIVLYSSRGIFRFSPTDQILFSISPVKPNPLEAEEAIHGSWP